MGFPKRTLVDACEGALFLTDFFAVRPSVINATAAMTETEGRMMFRGQQTLGALRSRYLKLDACANWVPLDQAHLSVDAVDMHGCSVLFSQVYHTTTTWLKPSEEKEVVRATPHGLTVFYVVLLLHWVYSLFCAS